MFQNFIGIFHFSLQFTSIKFIKVSNYVAIILQLACLYSVLDCILSICHITISFKVFFLILYMIFIEYVSTVLFLWYNITYIKKRIFLDFTVAIFQYSPFVSFNLYVCEKSTFVLLHYSAMITEFPFLESKQHFFSTVHTLLVSSTLSSNFVYKFPQLVTLHKHLFALSTRRLFGISGYRLAGSGSTFLRFLIATL